MRRGKNLDLTEEEVNKSDSNDEDYDDSQRAPKRKPPSSSHKTGRRSNRRKRSYDDDDDDDDISDEIDELHGSSEEEEEIEINPNTGRPSRSAARNRISMKESSDEEEGEQIEDSDMQQDDEDAHSVMETSESRVIKIDVSQMPRVKTRLAAIERPTSSRSARSNVSHSMSIASAVGRRSTRQSREPEALMELDARGRPMSASRPTSAGSDNVRRPVRPSRISTAAKHPAYTEPILEEDEPESQQPELLKSDVIGAGEVVAESPAAADGDADEGEGENGEGENDEVDEDEDAPPKKKLRSGRARAGDNDDAEFAVPAKRPPSKRPTRSSKKAVDESSDFEPDEAGAEDDDDEEEEDRRPSSRGKSGRPSAASDEDELDADELAEEAHDLRADRSRKRRRGQVEEPLFHSRPKRNVDQKDYRVFDPTSALLLEEGIEAAPSSRKSNNKMSAYYRNLYPVAGVFGGLGEDSVFADTTNRRLAAGADSDDSDDEIASAAQRRPTGLGAAIGLTPNSGARGGALASDAAQATGGGSAALGKIADRKLMADADPLGVDPNVSMEDVGGLQDHIQKLNEMVKNPLMYPDLYKDKGITPPRGVLFHGPPGTGKTLLARALAAQSGHDGQKVTFYMRKGADALSKWVGEAERQLRALFDDAKKNQPSIIFFDEIDGLAPVRSSKQEQIHASIVATLLALMDGMDGRGQVVVIGATNRPDSVDPALRRPGRFDREFYFPLPDEKARREILHINTKKWKPALEPSFVDQLAFLTKGYGGADLRALCTEAALNAIQGTYPQIYKSNRKLLVDPSSVKVQPKDFMLSLSKMIPSSERNTSSISAPLDSHIEPLLRDSFLKVSHTLDDLIPLRQHLTTLEEAEYDDRDDPNGFEREMMQQRFDKGRVYRPRLLITGMPGMGQTQLASAVLHKFERFFVQSFDLSAMHGDASRTPEQALTQMFEEVKRHKPSVIYIPDINVWYESVSSAVINMFKQKLNSLSASHPVLLLGVMEKTDEAEKLNPRMMRDMFPHATKKSVIEVKKPGDLERRQYFAKVIDYLKMTPKAFPDEERKKRQLPELELAPAPPPPAGPTEAERKAQKKAQKKQDRVQFNRLRLALHPSIEVLRGKREYNTLRKHAIPEAEIAYLVDESHRDFLTSDAPSVVDEEELQKRPYEFGTDGKGHPGIIRRKDQRFFYNLELTTIEKRFHNGFYTAFEDILADFKKIARDRRALGDEFGYTKAMEIYGGLEVDIEALKPNHPSLFQALEDIARRSREEEAEEEQRKRSERHSFKTPNQESPIVVRPDPSQGALSNGISSNGEVHHHSRPSIAASEDGAGEGLASNTQQNRSQKSAITAMAGGSQAADYHNSASTTTSGQKTDKSSHGTQGSNGVGHGPSAPPTFGEGPCSGFSQLPDTQEMNLPTSSSSQPNSQTSMAPPRAPLNMDAILNEAPKESEELICDDGELAQLHDRLTIETGVCNIEQLEHVMAVIMDTIWRNRGTWNRTSIVSKITAAFENLVGEMREYQDEYLVSQGDEMEQY